MKKFEGRLAAVLGTVIIHLMAGIIFMSFRISSIHNEMHDLVQVEYAPPEVFETVKKEKPAEPSVTSVEKVLQGDEEMLNIARNLANKGDPKINKADYIDKVKDELIKSGKLGKDNYIDEQKKQSALKGQEDISIKEDGTAGKKTDKPGKAEEMAANYKGPTRIYYNLTGRNHTYLPLPIYKCEGQGKVVLSIEVTQKGLVEKAVVVEAESTTSDPCLVETAVNTALVSRFNPDINAPKIQTGSLTYQFVAQ
jgi:hypothetical protein